MRWTAILSIVFFVATFSYAQIRESTTSLNELFLDNIKGFEPNQGQIIDQYRQTHPEVLYLSSKNKLKIAVTTTGISYFFFKNIGQSKADTTSPEKENDSVNFQINRIDMVLENASIRLDKIHVQGKSKSFSNYYLAHCKSGVEYVHTYKTLTISDVYPNIDWVIEDNGNQIKYTFVVHPGGDYTKINFTYKGQKKIKLSNKQHSYIVVGDLGQISEGNLHVYQNTVENKIPTKFNLHKNKVGFAVSKFDLSRDLIIDPSISWATFYGGIMADGPKAITSDQAGNVYVTGYGQSPDFLLVDLAGGAYYQALAVFNVDAILLKFSPTNEILWSTFYGGEGEDFGTDAVCDASGNLFITGYTNSSDFPTMDPGPGNYYQSTISSFMFDGFVAKFNALGIRQWATFYGGNDNDIPNGITSDPFGNIFVTGVTKSNDFPVFDPGGGAFYQGVKAGATDAFFIKLSSSAQQLWSTYFGGTGHEQVTQYGDNDIACDVDGNVFGIGNTQSISIPVISTAVGAFLDTTLSGTRDAYILKFSNSGVILWGTYFGGLMDDMGNNIAIGASNDVYVSGFTSSSSGFPLFDPGGPSFYDSSYNGGTYDFFIARFTNSGIQLWSTYFGGSNDESYGDLIFRHGLCTNSVGDVFLAGESLSNDFPVVDNGTYFQGTNAGFYDVVLTQFDVSNEIKWSSYYGLNGDQFPTAVHCVNDCLYLTGEYWLADGPVYNPGDSAFFQGTSGGGDDGFVAKFCTCTPPNINIDSSTVICLGQSLTLFAQGGISYVWITGETGDSLHVAPSVTTVYTVIGTDSIGCSSTASATIEVLPAASVGFTSNLPVCSGEEVVLVAYGMSEYNWGNGETNDSLFIYPSTDTLIHLTGMDGLCTSVLDSTIDIMPAPILDFDFDVINYCDSFTVAFTNLSIDALSYEWYFSNGLSESVSSPVLSVLTPGELMVSLIGVNGECKDSITRTIYLDCDSLLVIPNVFSPNNDGVNDVFLIRAEDFKNVECVIYNRWGQEVYRTHENIISWSGKKTNTDQDLSEGTYYYVFTATYIHTNRPTHFNGHITLVRDN